jgi:hypothetical protein
MTKSAAALAAGRLKQLCCMGLGREAITPALLVELRTLVPNRTSLIYYIDESHKRVGGYSDNPETVHTSELYVTEFFGRRGRELGGAFPDAIHTQFGVHDYADALRTIDVDWSAFVRSDFYNLIYRAHRSHWFMRLMVRGDGGRGRALGNVTLYRGPKEPPWRVEEKRRLAALEPFFAIALKEESKGVTSRWPRAVEAVLSLPMRRESRSISRRTAVTFSTSSLVLEKRLTPYLHDPTCCRRRCCSSVEIWCRSFPAIPSPRRRPSIIGISGAASPSQRSGLKAATTHPA